MKFSNIFLLALSLSLFSCTGKNNGPRIPSPVVKEKVAEIYSICKPSQNAAATLEKPIVILVSIDGLRADYIQKYKPENILKIIQQGIYSANMLPSYPSLTFPNHYSIATGRYPGNHGIVSNVFYDNERQEFYNAFNQTSNDGTWYEGEPLWNVAEKSGMIVHTLDWVGSSAHIGKMDPTCYTKYNGKVTFAKKIDKTLESLALPENIRPHLITLYTSEVDDAGHSAGPRSDKSRMALMNVDKELGRLWNRIQKLNLPINLVVVSDHGMEQLDKDKVIFLDDYISNADLATFQSSDRGASGMLYNDDPAQVKKAYEALKANEKNFKVYLKGQTPAQYHMDFKSRTGDIVIIPDIPYYITVRPVQGLPLILKAGTHGWAFENEAMHAFFMAAGNNIAVNRTVPTFQNVDVYPFLMNLLGLSTNVSYDGNDKTLSKYIVNK